MLLNARCNSQEELDEACSAAVARATALKEGLRVARDAMRENASAQPFTAPPQSLQQQPELEAKEE